MNTITKTLEPKYIIPNFVNFEIKNDDIIENFRKEFKQIIQEFDWHYIDETSPKCICKNKKQMILYLKQLLKKIKTIRLKNDKRYLLKKEEKDIVYIIYELKNYYIKQ